MPTPNGEGGIKWQALYSGWCGPASPERLTPYLLLLPVGRIRPHGHDWSPQEDAGVGAFSMAVNLPTSSILQQNSETMVFWLPDAEGPLVSRLCLQDTCVRKGAHPTMIRAFTVTWPACPSQSTGFQLSLLDQGFVCDLS